MMPKVFVIILLGSTALLIFSIAFMILKDCLGEEWRKVDLDFEKGTKTTRVFGFSFTRNIRPKAFRREIMSMARDIVRQEEIVDEMKPHIYGTGGMLGLSDVFRAEYNSERKLLVDRVYDLEQKVFPRRKKK